MNIHVVNLQQLEQSSTLLPGRETSLEGVTSGKKMEDSLQKFSILSPDFQNLYQTAPRLLDGFRYTRYLSKNLTIHRIFWGKINTYLQD